VPEHRRPGDAAGGPLSPAEGGPAQNGSARRGPALAIAVAASAALILAAPALGSARSALRAAFPGAFSRLIEGTLALAVLGAFAAGVAGIRTRRLARYGALAAAMATAWAYSAATGSPDPAIRAVERVHFVAFGLIAWLFQRAWRDRPDASALVAPFVAAAIAGIADEAFQWFLPARVGELGDVALNGVAIGCGLLIGWALAPPPSLAARWRGDSIRLVGRLGALAIVALAAFVHLVHLGVAIDAPGIGRFDSRYTAAGLEALTADRAAAWRTAPPLVRPPRFSREDQYMTEGLQHVQARNTAWDAGDARTAWRENLILERYFVPVLDTPSYVAKAGHRWPAEQRADAARRASGTEAQPFESRAYPYRLFRWPPVALWAIALAAAAAAWIAGARAARRAAPR
jgi:VanZ family protein